MYSTREVELCCTLAAACFRLIRTSSIPSNFDVLFILQAYIVARNFREKGLLLELADFTCPQVIRDLKWAAGIITAAGAGSLCIYGLLLAWIHKYIRWNTAVYLYICYQTTVLSGVVLTCYLTPIAPLPTAGSLLLVAVIQLKSHSYLATNYAIYSEHVHRYGTMLLESRLSPRHIRTASAPAGSIVGAQSPSKTQRQLQQQASAPAEAEHFPLRSSASAHDKPLSAGTACAPLKQSSASGVAATNTIGPTGTSTAHGGSPSRLLPAIGGNSLAAASARRRVRSSSSLASGTGSASVRDGHGTPVDTPRLTEEAHAYDGSCYSPSRGKGPTAEEGGERENGGMRRSGSKSHLRQRRKGKVSTSGIAAPAGSNISPPSRPPTHPIGLELDGGGSSDGEDVSGDGEVGDDEESGHGSGSGTAASVVIRDTEGPAFSGLSPVNSGSSSSGNGGRGAAGVLATRGVSSSVSTTTTSRDNHSTGVVDVTATTATATQTASAAVSSSRPGGPLEEYFGSHTSLKQAFSGRHLIDSNGQPAAASDDVSGLRLSSSASSDSLDGLAQEEPEEASPLGAPWAGHGRDGSRIISSSGGYTGTSADTGADHDARFHSVVGGNGAIPLQDLMGPLPPASAVGAAAKGQPDIISGTREQKRRLIKAWPHNVTIKDFLYFLFAPTLVYEPRYPRTKAIRWKYVAVKGAEVCLSLLLQYALLKQFLLPVLRHPSEPSEPTVIHKALALGFDVMRLAIPSLVVWLLLFYAFFHCAMNITAELLCFADR